MKMRMSTRAVATNDASHPPAPAVREPLDHSGRCNSSTASRSTPVERNGQQSATRSNGVRPNQYRRTVVCQPQGAACSVPQYVDYGSHNEDTTVGIATWLALSGVILAGGTVLLTCVS